MAQGFHCLTQCWVEGPASRGKHPYARSCRGLLSFQLALYIYGPPSLGIGVEAINFMSELVTPSKLNGNNYVV